MDWWNHIPEYINPNIIEIGSFKIRYYSMMYVVAFILTYQLIMYRVRNEKYEYSKNTIQAFLLYAILGVLIGGKLGYVLFYDLTYYIEHPLKIICPFDFSNGFRYTGLYGMSYHGGLIGVILASLIFCHRKKINFWHFMDLLSPAIPLGYTFGRIGNFINGELYGRITSMPWGMYFPLDPTCQLRHPSQLYEALFEGIFLFIFLWNIRRIKPFNGFHSGLYLIGYGSVRFFIEFFREPDDGLGAIWLVFTMGQLLCIFMILGGVSIILIRKNSNQVFPDRT